MLEALLMLRHKGLMDKFHLHIYGGVSHDVGESLATLPNVTLHGWYHTSDLDAILSGIHVGIIPSVWEEVYGFVGVEFLRKGIPVIGNAMGGIPEYTKTGETGWLNRTSTAEELADIMTQVIEKPEEISRLNHELLANQSRHIKFMSDHVQEMTELYQRVIRSKAPHGG